MSATIRITRPFRMADAARHYHIMLDGEKAAELRNRHAAEIPVPAGTHTLQVRVPSLIGGRPGLGSREITLEVGGSESIEFSCHPPRFVPSWYRWIAVLIADPDAWLSLSQVP